MRKMRGPIIAIIHIQALSNRPLQAPSLRLLQRRARCLTGHNKVPHAYTPINLKPTILAVPASNQPPAITTVTPAHQQKTVKRGHAQYHL